ncbi:MAG: molybdenum cofactor biosynthesis protein MoaE [Dehalococcoidia bacterium]
MVASGIRLEIRLFAVLRERFGTDSLPIEVADGATVGDLRDLLSRLYPDSAEILARTAFALGEDYADDEARLTNGVTVALIPPVSGGSGLIVVTHDQLDAEEATRLVRADDDGAVCVFLGVVRNHNDGKQVSHLEYEAFPEMAEKQLAQIAEEAARRFDVDRVALHHRIGRLEVGEVSLVAAVSAQHRGASFDACHWAVDTLKARVPIWKKEVGPDGEEWLEGTAVGIETAG